MKKAVMIGAGQIGRGFIGMLLEQAGYYVVFADINEDVIRDINTRKEYPVHLVDKESVNTTVRNIRAISSLSPELREEYATCSLICTSVGLTAFPKIAPALAQGIALRRERGETGPLNIIACENGLHGTTRLKELIFEHLDAGQREYAEEHVGFPDCAVDRIIPPAKGMAAAETVVERYHEWDVERDGFKGEIPEIPGMEVVDDLSAYVERKLFTLNGPNAVTGCYGWLKGYETVNEALLDPEIYQVVYGMMEEVGHMLEKRHGFTAEQMKSYRDGLIRRFENPYIIDTCTRVAREPIRKLSPDDRIIAPMKYAEEYGIETSCYYTGIAAILLYDNPEDEQAREIRRQIREGGVGQTLQSVCGIAPESETAGKITAEYERLRAMYRPDQP
jgi:mannitol-1-phosphate 5-dehydrogenase